MSSRVLPFVDTERIVVAWLKSQLPTGYSVRTDLPNPLEPALPLVQVYRVSGSLDAETTAIGRIELHCFAANRGAMWALTSACVAAMSALAGQTVNGQDFDRVNLTQDPGFLAWSASVPRSISVYELQYRPRSA